MSQAFVDWLAEHDAKVEVAIGEKVAQAIEKARDEKSAWSATDAASIARMVTGGKS